MAKRMNKNQKSLHKALDAVSNGVLFLEDALCSLEKKSKQEIDDEFSDKIRVTFDGHKKNTWYPVRDLKIL